MSALAEEAVVLMQREARDWPDATEVTNLQAVPLIEGGWMLEYIVVMPYAFGADRREKQRQRRVAIYTPGGQALSSLILEVTTIE